MLKGFTPASVMLLGSTLIAHAVETCPTKANTPAQTQAALECHQRNANTLEGQIGTLQARVATLERRLDTLQPQRVVRYGDIVQLRFGQNTLCIEQGEPGSKQVLMHYCKRWQASQHLIVEHPAEIRRKRIVRR